MRVVAATVVLAATVATCFLTGFLAGYDEGKAAPEPVCTDRYAHVAVPDCDHLSGEAWRECMHVGRK